MLTDGESKKLEKRKKPEPDYSELDAALEAGERRRAAEKAKESRSNGWQFDPAELAELDAVKERVEIEFERKRQERIRQLTHVEGYQHRDLQHRGTEEQRNREDQTDSPHPLAVHPCSMMSICGDDEYESPPSQNNPAREAREDTTTTVIPNPDWESHSPGDFESADGRPLDSEIPGRAGNDTMGEHEDGMDIHLRSSASICGSNKTTLGTPISPRWSEEWIDLVNETEERLGRRCCGAHAPDDLPCELESTHENGRCRFHGGARNSGAQKGNANAQLHGLYSKRLQRCGKHCRKWKTCPHGGDDVDALPPEKRPYCPYEVEELEALRALDRSAHERYVPLKDREMADLERAPYPVYAQLFMQRENLNMLQVQISRAARMLGVGGFETEGVRQTDKKYEVTPKVSPIFQAYMHLQREFRLAMRTYLKTIEQFGMPKYERP